MPKHRKKQPVARGGSVRLGAAVAPPPPSPSTLPPLTSIAKQATTTEASLAALRQTVDVGIETILFSAPHVVVYNFDVQLSRWQRANREGALFLVRYREPRYALVVHNRKSPENLVDPIVPGIDLEVQDEFLMYRTVASGGSEATPFARAIWFHGGAPELQACANLLQDIAWMQHQVAASVARGELPPSAAVLGSVSHSGAGYPRNLPTGSLLPPHSLPPNVTHGVITNAETKWNSGWTSPVTAWSPSETKQSSSAHAGPSAPTSNLVSQPDMESRPGETDMGGVHWAALGTSGGPVGNPMDARPGQMYRAEARTSHGLVPSQPTTLTIHNEANDAVFTRSSEWIHSGPATVSPSIPDEHSEIDQTLVNTVMAAAGGRPGIHHEVILSVLRALVNEPWVFEKAYKNYRMQWG